MKKLILLVLPVLAVSSIQLQADNFGAGLGVGMVTGGVGGLILGKASSGDRSRRGESNKELRREVRELEDEIDYLRQENAELKEMVRQLRAQGQ